MDNLRKAFLVKGNSIVGAVGDKYFSTCPLGTVLSYAGNIIPRGFLVCDGASYPTADYPDLYAVIGNTYGGDTENFNVPDYRETVLVGVGENTTDTIADHDVYELGEFKDDQLQSHIHDISRNGDGSSPYFFQNNGSGSIYHGALTTTTTGQDATPIVTGIPTARRGDTTHGKQKGVTYIIKAFHTNEGVDSGAGDDVINYINNSNSYSTEETLTGGTWIDGKPIYRKVFKVLKSELERDESVNTNRWYSPIFALSIDEIVNYDVLAFRNNGMIYKSVDYILNDSYSIVWTFSGFLFKNNSEIRIGSFMGDALYNDLSHIYGILYYTKS